ncbi:MAG TPA: hypothetical protein VJ915_13200, partial [Balneolaceae bacterium]|nr:hypothetical protein [Balneolaceae bacterium]
LSGNAKNKECQQKLISVKFTLHWVDTDLVISVKAYAVGSDEYITSGILFQSENVNPEQPPANE